VTNLYDLMDSAYDVAEITAKSRSLGHVPIIDPHPRSMPGGKEAIEAEARARCKAGYVPAEEVRRRQGAKGGLPYKLLCRAGARQQDIQIGDGPAHVVTANSDNRLPGRGPNSRRSGGVRMPGLERSRQDYRHLSHRLDFAAR
jgi:hypothetical protein